MTYRLYDADMLNRYAKDCHERSVAKGFWDEPRNTVHYLMLVISELSEAVEADRIGRWAKLDHDTIDTLQRIEGTPYAQEFLRLVKDTVEDEIADAVIRLLDLLFDLLGGYELKSSDLDKVRGADVDRLPSEELPYILFWVTEELCRLWRAECLRLEGIPYAIKALEQLCDHLGIDLMMHIELKLKYNETRPVKHGKKY